MQCHFSVCCCLFHLVCPVLQPHLCHISTIPSNSLLTFNPFLIFFPTKTDHLASSCIFNLLLGSHYFKVLRWVNTAFLRLIDKLFDPTGGAVTNTQIQQWMDIGSTKKKTENKIKMSLKQSSLLICVLRKTDYVRHVVSIPNVVDTDITIKAWFCLILIFYSLSNARPHSGMAVSTLALQQEDHRLNWCCGFSLGTLVSSLSLRFGLTELS